ncbi:hypothetical protein C5O75_022980 [Burkholderia cepacia]|nr:hypothetical protein C5O75_022980 [Burkholderia cepacia]
MVANVPLLEIHRQRPDLDHGRLQVPHDDRRVNTAVHQGGNAHPCSAAGRAQSLKMWTECKHRINKNLEGKCAGLPPTGAPAGGCRAE